MTGQVKKNDVDSHQTYIAYGSTAFSRFLLGRTAEKNATFFVSFLHPGMNLLDCGSGPGSITIGLAKRVAPGQTIGIDINPGELEFALKHFADQVSPPIQFERASIYDLPFDDHAFDAVFSHAVLEHLSQPLKALQEMNRVLKPGGMVGIRNPDKDGQLLAPVEPALVQFWEAANKVVEINGGNMRIG